MRDELSVWFGGIVYRLFEPPVSHYADILLSKVIPLFDDVEAEQERRGQEVLNADGWGEDDYERAMDTAYDESISYGISFMEMRSLYLATGVSGLFHLFEKQLFKYLNHELRDRLIVPITTWPDAAELLDKLTNRYGDGDPTELQRNFRSADLKELRLVAHAVKHGPGRAYDELVRMGAAVVDPARTDDDWTVGEFSPLAVRIVIQSEDIERYRDAILRFWSTEGTYGVKPRGSE